MPLDYAPSDHAVRGIANGLNISVDIFNDTESVTFGIWEMLPAGQWVLKQAIWKLPISDAGDFTMPGQAPENETFVHLFMKYAAAMITGFIDAVNAALATLYPFASDPPADPPATVEPSMEDCVGALQSDLAGAHITQADGQPPVFSFG